MANKRVKIYDPARDAYYDVDVDTAKKYVASLEEVKKAVTLAEKEVEA